MCQGLLQLDLLLMSLCVSMKSYFSGMTQCVFQSPQLLVYTTR